MIWNNLTWDSPTLLQQPSCTPNPEKVRIWFSVANCGKQEEADRSSGYVICWISPPSAPLVNPNTPDGNILQCTGWSVVTHAHGTQNSDGGIPCFIPSWLKPRRFSTDSTSHSHKQSVTSSFSLSNQYSHATSAWQRWQTDCIHTWNIPSSLTKSTSGKNFIF